MSVHSEIEAFLRRHLDSVFANDVAEYHTTTAEDLTLYEWCFTPVAPRRVRADDPDQPHRYLWDYILTASPAIRQN
jgi:hypothetical protein